MVTKHILYAYSSYKHHVTNSRWTATDSVVPVGITI